jgi:hypothetical protein
MYMDLREVVYELEKMGNLSHGSVLHDWLSHGICGDAGKVSAV